MRRLFGHLAVALSVVVMAVACGSVNSPPDAAKPTTPGGDDKVDDSKDVRSSVIDSGSIAPDADPVDRVDAATDAPTGAPTVKHTNESMTFAGLTRTYILAVPSTYNAAKKYPLVLAFHGNPGTAVEMRTTYPFDGASRQDAIIAYPQATNDEWDLYTATPSNADMNFTKALIDEIAKKVNVDKTRVLGHGFSGGGFFVTQMACRFAGVFKAISVHSGGGPDEPNLANPPKLPNGCIKCAGGPIAAFVFHGAADGTVEPGSGDFTAECFATYNGCQSSRTDTAPAPCKRHDGCPSGKPVDWCLIPGLDHAMWSKGTQAAWDFFRALP